MFASQSCRKLLRTSSRFSRKRASRSTTILLSHRSLSESATPENNNNNSSALSSSSSLQGYPLNAAECNVSTNIAERVGMNLHRRPNHPLAILQKKILEYWTPQNFILFDNLSPIVSTERNFDTLRIPPDHVSRSPQDTYYLNRETVLRTHTSAHQVDLLAAGNQQFLVSGDVYRRDAIDRSHYPVFHQMEGVKLFETSSSNNQQEQIILDDLKDSLQGLAVHLFGPDTPTRWVDAYFPFTHPSMELEIYFDDEWLEVLGCGVIHPDIVKGAGLPPTKQQGWAFGLGLERLAMVLFGIPDIRLFWTADERFHRQFAANEIVTFQPYSKYPACYKDISFWLPGNGDDGDDVDTRLFHVHDLNEIVRGVAGDWVEQVSLMDEFVHAQTCRTSHCYRISYRSMDRSLTNEEIDALQERVRERVVNELGVELR